MRALSVEELGFVSGGSDRATEVVIVWGHRISFSGGGGGGGTDGGTLPIEQLGLSPDGDGGGQSRDFLDFLGPGQIDALIGLGAGIVALPFAAGSFSTVGLIIAGVTFSPFVCGLIATGIAIGAAATIASRLIDRKTGGG